MEKNLVPKADNSDSSGDDANMAYLTRRFQKMVHRNGGYFIKDFPLYKQDPYKHNTDKTAERNRVSNRKFKRKNAADNVSDEDEDDNDDEGAVNGSNQRWNIDSSYSKHMTGSTDNFRSLKALKGRSVSFGNGKNGYILGVGRVGKTLTHSIENVYYVNVGDLTCLSAIDDDVELWHRRLGHASFSLLNKLVKKDLVRGLPKSRFKDHRVCDACVKGKQVRSSFKPKKGSKHHKSTGSSSNGFVWTCESA
ncbi:PREDICTED: uncharacterized protein LOC109231564 [Nicotiana attenuata]|uniref:uncharacterized protein LOC109231564 n=1 Tax=Nicotiana attenuata TaxID=49451 RepID=UPI00090581A1|nr:PREDICTED: uncharacterized protein LOC109231564 [Nicotiana attenuata]